MIDPAIYRAELPALAMWTAWQDKVKAVLPFYARSPVYVDQAQVSAQDLRAVVSALDPVYDLPGRTRDLPHGASAFLSSWGPVTRQWVDGNVEIDFLARHVPVMAHQDVLDIGAGYGRLAVMLEPHVLSYTCVDAVPISVQVCRDYCALYAPSVRVLDIEQFVDAMPTLRPTLAVNVHSWNECSRAQISRWLDVLDDLAVPHLCTVAHGATKDQYFAWEPESPEFPDFKALIAARWTLLVEECIGLGRSPHALWARKDA